MPSEIFPFRFFDPIRGRWVQARYKATPEDIAKRHERWEITGPGWTPNPIGVASDVGKGARVDELLPLFPLPPQVRRLDLPELPDRGVHPAVCRALRFPVLPGAQR